MKLDALGAVLWDRPTTDSVRDYPAVYQIALDSVERPIVAGTYEYGTYPYPVFFKFSPGGQVLWSRAAGFSIDVTRLTVDDADRITVFGATDWLPVNPYYSGKIMAFNPTGAFAWTTILGTQLIGTRVEKALLVGQGSTAMLHIGHSETAEVARFDPTGTHGSIVPLDPQRAAVGNDLATDGAGNVFVTGSLEGPLGTLDRRLAVWGVDPTGGVRVLHVFAGGPSDRSTGSSIGVAASGELIVTGRLIDRDVGFEMGLAPDGTELWRNERSGETSLSLWQQGSHDAVVTEVAGHHFALRHKRTSMSLAKYVPGGQIGVSYCGPAVSNSSGASGVIAAIGEQDVSRDNVTLQMSNLPPGTIAMLLAGRMRGSSPMLGGGEGTLCLGGPIGRFGRPEEIRVVRSDGSASFRIDTGRLPTPTAFVPAVAGETWNFQAWYRDANPLPTSNLTDAVAIWFR